MLNHDMTRAPLPALPSSRLCPLPPSSLPPPALRPLGGCQHEAAQRPHVQPLHAPAAALRRQPALLRRSLAGPPLLRRQRVLHGPRLRASRVLPGEGEGGGRKGAGGGERGCGEMEGWEEGKKGRELQVVVHGSDFLSDFAAAVRGLIGRLVGREGGGTRTEDQSTVLFSLSPIIPRRLRPPLPPSFHRRHPSHPSPSLPFSSSPFLPLFLSLRSS